MSTSTPSGNAEPSPLDILFPMIVFFLIGALLFGVVGASIGGTLGAAIGAIVGSRDTESSK